jgi:hypothetical protein
LPESHTVCIGRVMLTFTMIASIFASLCIPHDGFDRYLEIYQKRAISTFFYVLWSCML